MSTAAPPAVTPTAKNELKIVSHSALFYWWPVWAVGYLMALLTLFNDHRMALVPPKTEVKKAIEVKTVLNEKDTQDLKDRWVLIMPPGTTPPPGAKTPPEPHLWMTDSKNPGVLFCIILLLVVAITNIPLRGLWSVIVIITIIMLAVIFALMGIWERIMEAIGFLDIRINFGGYIFLSTVLLILWLIAFFLFDQQIYMIFTPGQFRVRQEIGEGEIVHDTTGMTVQKQRSDLFRHWILGLGSGDLIVKTAGAHPMQFDLPNVLFLGRRVREIEEMLRSRQVVAAPHA
jgi:hypothetical protein